MCVHQPALQLSVFGRDSVKAAYFLCVYLLERLGVVCFLGFCPLTSRVARCGLSCFRVVLSFERMRPACSLCRQRAAGRSSAKLCFVVRRLACAHLSLYQLQPCRLSDRLCHLSGLILPSMSSRIHQYYPFTRLPPLGSLQQSQHNTHPARPPVCRCHPAPHTLGPLWPAAACVAAEHTPAPPFLCLQA